MHTITVVGPSTLLRDELISLLQAIDFSAIQLADHANDLANSSKVARPSQDSLVLCLLLDLEAIIGTMLKIKAWEPTARIVILGRNFDIEAITTCFAAGVSGYLLDTISPDVLRQSLLLVKAGEKVFPSELVSALPMIFRGLQASNLVRPDQDLSPREIEILECLSNGQSNKVIAKNLDIAEATVKTHVKRILRKAGVANRTQAALWGRARAVTSETGIAAAA